MTYQTLRTDLDRGVFTVTLHRPERLNALSREMGAELIDLIDRVDRDDDVRAVIVTGAGRGFCAGADLGSGGGSFDRGESAAARAHRDEGGLITLRLFDSAKPWIAAINGPAVGVGVTMTLAMDVRVCSESARFGFVFARRGIVPEACSSWFLPRVVGIGRAMEWVATGRVFGAQEALAGGLVTRVLPDADLLPAAREIAREIADHTSAISVALSRQMLWKMLGADHPMEAHRLDSAGVQATGRSADAYEGVSSFLEKRPPRFTLKVSRDMPMYYPWWDARDFEALPEE
jgi:enoyl-CoA hydratase/carnithine racemase